MLDADLARLYGRQHQRALNQALRRNRERFPDDFVFQSTAEEFAFFSVTNVISNTRRALIHRGFVRTGHSLWTSSRKHRGRTLRPYAFTEQGVACCRVSLRSRRACGSQHRYHAQRSSSCADSWTPNRDWPERSKRWKRNMNEALQRAGTPLDGLALVTGEATERLGRARVNSPSLRAIKRADHSPTPAKKQIGFHP